MKNYFIKNITLILLLIYCSTIYIFSDNSITVYNKIIQNTIKNIFGNNLIGYDPVTWESWTKEYYGYSDFGAGIWDPEIRLPIKKVVDFAKEAGISVLRFPGGCGVHHYNWKNSIGANRENFLFGLDEFLKVCQQVDAEPVITVSYFTGNEKDCADLVEYLNSPADNNHPWALKRAQNGHENPYHVKYFEIGNEVFHGNHRDIKYIVAEDYAKKYLKYYSAMKAVDPAIQIGVVLFNAEWDKIVAEIIKDRVDFGIYHLYPTPVWGEGLEKVPPKKIFEISLAMPALKYEPIFKNTLELFQKKSGKKLSLAITEYNGGFVQEKPVPYRHTLGCALVNAELIRIFMKPENNIIIANYWQFCNSYWGMITNDFSDDLKDLYNPYYKRPNYYVYEMYNKHFGEILLHADVNCDGYEMSTDYKEVKIPFLSVNCSKSKDGEKLYLMVINKNLNNPVTATINLKDFIPKKNANIWILNGPDIDSTNESGHETIKIFYKTINISSECFDYTFEAHSLTAIEINKM